MTTTVEEIGFGRNNDQWSSLGGGLEQKKKGGRKKKKRQIINNREQGPHLANKERSPFAS